MTKTNWKNLGLIALAVLLVGALAFAVVGDEVFADDGDEPTEEPEDGDGISGFGPGANHPVREKARNFMRYGKEAFVESVAEQTDVTVEDLEAALEDKVKIEDYLVDAGYSEEEVQQILLNAQYAVVDQAVEEGKMTEEEAEDAKAKLTEVGAMREEWAVNREEYHQLWYMLIAEKTEFTVAEIEEAADKGIGVQKLLEGTYPEEEAHAIINEAWAEMVDQALAEGLITEEQAESLAERVPFNGDRARGRIIDRVKDGIANGLEERFGEGWREEFQRRMNPDCDCTCPEDGE